MFIIIPDPVSKANFINLDQITEFYPQGELLIIFAFDEDYTAIGKYPSKEARDGALMKIRLSLGVIL